MIGRPDVEGVSYVNVDNRGGAMQAAIHLCNLGYQRIGLLGAPVSTTAGLDRLNGFVEGLAICGMALHPSLRADGDFSEASGYQAMLELIPHKPEAVFAASDTMAVGALRALREEWPQGSPRCRSDGVRRPAGFGEFGPSLDDHPSTGDGNG